MFFAFNDSVQETLTAARRYGYQLVGERGDVPPVIKVIDGAALLGFPALFNTTLSDGTMHKARPVIRFELLDAAVAA